MGELVQPEQRVGCLRCVRYHLTDAGRLAIDLRMPDLALLADAQRSAFPNVRHERASTHPEPGVIRPRRSRGIAHSGSRNGIGDPFLHFGRNDGEFDGRFQYQRSFRAEAAAGVEESLSDSLDGLRLRDPL